MDARDRRRDGRAKVAGSYANRYIDGIPHTVELLDLSETGVRVRRILEPETRAEAFAVELAVGDVRFWAWTRRVWRSGSHEALRIVAIDPLDRARLRKALRAARAA